MTHRDIVNGWLAGIGQHLGTELGLNEDGLCALQYKEDLVCIVEVTETNEFVHFFVPLVQVTGDDYTDFGLYAKALDLNLYQLKTEGGSIALTPDQNHLALCYRHLVDGCDQTAFANILDNIIGTAEGLRAEFRAYFISLAETGADAPAVVGVAGGGAVSGSSRPEIFA